MQRKRRNWNVMGNRYERPTFNGKIYAGEGKLHTLLRMVGISGKEFCRVADIPEQVYYRWYGHPLHGWPIVMLELIYMNRGMQEYLQRHGVDITQFEPKLPTEYRTDGRYPRKEGDLDIRNLPAGDWSPFHRDK